MTVVREQESAEGIVARLAPRQGAHSLEQKLNRAQLLNGWQACIHKSWELGVTPREESVVNLP